MALERVNAVIVGAGAGGGIVAKELADGRTERGAARARQVVLSGRLPQGRSAQPAHRTCSGNGFGPDDETQSARRGGRSTAASASCCRSEGGYNNNAGLRGRRHLQLWRDGMALHGKGLPHALDLRRAGRQHARGLARSATTTSSRTTKRPNGRSASRATCRAIRSRRRGASPADAARCRRTASTRSCGRRRSGWACIPSTFRCCATACPTTAAVLHALPLVRGLRLRSERQVRHAQHRDPQGARHRQLRTCAPSAWPRKSSPMRAGACTGVAYFDADDRLREQPADLVIVCGGGHRIRAAAAEFARALLFPNGLGNRYDWVGRNLQGHTPTRAPSGSSTEEVYDDLGPGAGIAICDYNHGNPGLAGGAMLANEFIRLPYSVRRPSAARCRAGGRRTRISCAAAYRRTIAVMGPVQEMPMFDSRVQVDPKVKDHWGIPVARLSGSRHPHTIEIGEVHGRKGRGLAEGSGRGQKPGSGARPGPERRAAPGRHLPHGRTIRRRRWWTGTAGSTTWTTST